MGSISCCDKRFWIRGDPREEFRPEAITLRRNGKQTKLTSILAISNIDGQNGQNSQTAELNPKNTINKSPRNKTIIEMDEKLKKIQKKNDNCKELEKLSGKKLLAEVFS